MSCRDKEVEMREAWERISREGEGFKMGVGGRLVFILVGTLLVIRT